MLINASIEIIRRRQQIDIVIFYLGSYYAPLLLIAKILNKKILIYDPASEAVITERVYKARRGWSLLSNTLGLLSWINRVLADLIVIQSPKVIHQGRLEPFQEKLRIVNNNLDIDSYKNIVKFRERKQIVGFVGRLSGEKGINHLLTSAYILRNSGIDFVIVGDGPLRREVEAGLLSRDLSNVSYLGWIEKSRIVHFYNEIRLLVLPSSGEGVPNAVLEAMACGTPVLATPVGGVADLIVHQQTGFLLPDTRPETIAGAIVEALQSPNLEVIAKRGQDYVRCNYSLPVSSSQWQAILCEVFQLN
jgi:glycosyltransferase involved in cell wall biosynthesis